MKIETFRFADLTPAQINKYKKLTLNPYSGMNIEINNLLDISENRKPEAFVISATVNKKIVGWILYSMEDSYFIFNSFQNFKKNEGSFLQVYVEPTYRNKGIAKSLMRRANKIYPGRKIVACTPVKGIQNLFSRYFSNVEFK